MICEDNLWTLNIEDFLNKFFFLDFDTFAIYFPMFLSKNVKKLDFLHRCNGISGLGGRVLAFRAKGPGCDSRWNQFYGIKMILLLIWWFFALNLRNFLKVNKILIKSQKTNKFNHQNSCSTLQGLEKFARNWDSSIKAATII